MSWVYLYGCILQLFLFHCSICLSSSTNTTLSRLLWVYKTWNQVVESSNFVILQGCVAYSRSLPLRINFILFYFILTSLLEYNCFTMVCSFLLYNKVNQLYIYMYLHISYLLRLLPIFPIPPLQVFAKHRADMPVLCGCFPLDMYFTFVSVYMSMPLSHFVPASPSPSPCPQVHSLRLHLYSFPAPRFFRTIFFLFLDSIYVC